MKRLMAFALTGLISSSVYAVPVTEGFEDETHAATAFSQGGYDFSVTGDLFVEDWLPGYGSGGSDVWLGTGTDGLTENSGPTIGSAGSIQIDTANSYFQVLGFDAWTSDNDGGYDASGNVTFTGTEYLTGNTFIETLFIDPSGISGGDWHQDLVFSGDLLGKNLVSIAASLGSSINYLALDNLDFDITTMTIPTPPTPAPEPSAILMIGAGLVAFSVMKRKA